MTKYKIAVRAAAAILLASLAGAAVTFAGLADTSSPQNSARAGAEMLDYLVQDVCVDINGRAIPGDPASCRVHRDLRPGERLPYIVTDFDRNAGVSLGSMSSVPVRGSDGNLMVIVTKDLRGRYTPDFQFSFAREKVAFDLIDVSHSPYASIVRTFDGGCFDQLLSRNGRVKALSDRAGGWVLVPLSPAPSQWRNNGSLRLTTWRQQLDPARAQCASNHAAGLTSWAAPASYTFESGKRLRALRSDHYASADLTRPENSFERFYLTREYGTARWEAWWTVAYCQKTLGARSPRCGQSADNALRSRCSVLKLPGNAIAGLEIRGGQPWVRMDCRDSTRYLALNRPQLMLSPEMARGRGVIDVDYSATVSAH
jgi:hypothetical protein